MIKKLFKKWMRIAQKIGDFQARLILSVLYFVIIPPAALFRYIFSRTSKTGSVETSNWIDKKNKDNDIQNLRDQF